MFKNYITFKHIRGDFFGGITAGIVALPLALAFGEQSGLGAAAGLFGAIAIGFFSSLFCSTQQQISGPTAPMTAVSVVVVSEIIQSFNGDVASAMPSILLVFFLAGVFQVILGIIGVGKYIKYIPYPVISGFMNGIAIIILMGQIFPLLGYVASQDKELVDKNKIIAESNLMAKQFQSFDLDKAISAGDISLIREKMKEVRSISDDAIEKEAETISSMQVKTPAGIIKNMPRGIRNINWSEFIFVVGTVLVIYGSKYIIRHLPDRIRFFAGLKKIASSIPTTLIALVLMSGIAIFFNLDLLKIQSIPQGFPGMHFEIFTGFSYNAVKPFIMAAVSLAMLGSIDSLLTSVIVDTKEKTRHNSSQELVSQGIGNSMAAMFGGIPGSSATIRTLLNMNSGGVTRLSGIFASLLLLSILLFFAPVASLIPSSVLAGVLVTVGIGIFDYRGLKAIGKTPRWDVAVMIIVMLLTVFVDLVIAVGVGLVISALIFMKKMGDINTKKSTVLTLDSVKSQLWENQKDLPVDLSHNVFVKHLEGPLFFGYTNDLQQLYTQIPEEAEYVILQMDKVPYVDQSGLYSLEDIIVDLVQKKKKVLIVGLQSQPNYLIRKIEIIPNLVPEEMNFKTFEDSLKWLRQDISECGNKS